ncbi:hypothetical protein ACFL2Q_01855 [Thermodesulfobacteriota bacterium]
MDDPQNTDEGCYTEHGVSGYGVAVKLASESAMDEATVKATAEKIMMIVAQNCMDRGARCIGHIKSHVRTDAGTIKADTIGIEHGTYSTGHLEHPVTQMYMAVNSIVQGIHQDEVRIATLDGIHEGAEGQQLAVTTEKEHAYFDEFDFMASKEEYRRQLEEQLAAQEADEAGKKGSG